jgi:hypothetical protein
VYYNLALALARASNLEESLKYVDLALKRPHKKIKSKAASLKNRLTSAIKTGADFHLLSAKADIAAAVPEKAEGEGEEGSDNNETSAPASVQALVLSALTVDPGQIGCFLVYLPEMEIPGQTSITAIKFAKRAGIERAETMKAEKGLKSA